MAIIFFTWSSWIFIPICNFINYSVYSSFVIKSAFLDFHDSFASSHDIKLHGISSPTLQILFFLSHPSQCSPYQSTTSNACIRSISTSLKFWNFIPHSSSLLWYGFKELFHSVQYSIQSGDNACFIFRMIFFPKQWQFLFT